MKNFNKNLTMVLFAVMTLSLSLMAAGCSKKAVQPAEDDNLNKATKLVIGQNANFFPIIVAYEKGFFKEELGDTIEVDIPLFLNGPAQNEAIKAGQLDIASMGDLPVVQLWANDTDIQVISYFFAAPDGFSLVANKQSGIKTLADLKGKKVAIQPGTNNHKLTLKFLGSQGFDRNDVELVNLQRSEAIVALKQGIVDATALLEPHRSEVLKDDNIIEISTSRGYDNFYGLTFARTEYARENPQIISRYLKAIKKANDWIAQNADEATRLVLKFMGTDNFAETKIFLESRLWPVGADQELINELNGTIKFCREQELITRDDLDAKNLVNIAYAKAAGL